MFYKPEEAIYVCSVHPYSNYNNKQCNDGREPQLLEFIRKHPRYDDMKNSPDAVLAAIDEFACTQDFLMNVGREKGRVVTDLIARQNPSTLLEIGGYVGFSAIMFGNELRKASGGTAKYLSLELSPVFAAVARELIALAGLQETVQIIEGPCRESLRQLQQARPGPFDVIFIDHVKVLYLNELKLCEELGFVKPGTTVIADDMVQTPNPQYSSYMREPIAVKKQQLLNAKPEEGEDLSLGNPLLVYETKLIHGCEPSGNDVGVSILRSSLTFSGCGGNFAVHQ